MSLETRVCLLIHQTMAHFVQGPSTAQQRVARLPGRICSQTGYLNVASTSPVLAHCLHSRFNYANSVSFFIFFHWLSEQIYHLVKDSGENWRVPKVGYNDHSTHSKDRSTRLCV